MISFRVSIYLGFVVWLISPGEGNIKRWRPNTNYGNPDNWNVGRPPCDGDNLSFPAISPPIFLEQEVKIVMLELPMTGEIVLGEGASISPMVTPIAVSSTPSGSSEAESGTDSCSRGQGQKVEFIRTNYLNWLDPDNWCEAESEVVDCLQNQPPKLDTERVPCIHDDVVFPRESTFMVRQNYTDSQIKIKSLSIQGVIHTQDSLTEFLKTTEGKKQFDVSQEGQLQITQEECKDVTGCACGNDRGMIMHKICEYQATKCPPLSCHTPIMPKGHCCQICGTILIMDYRYGFKLAVLQQKIKENFIDGRKGNVFVVISKLSNDRIQMVIRDVDNDGMQAKKSGEKMKEYIEKDIRGLQKLGLSSITIQASGDSLKPSTSHIKSKKFLHSSGSIAGVVIAIFIVLILIGAVMFCFIDRTQCRRRLKLPLNLGNPFRRFSGDNEKGDLEMDDSISYVDIMKAQGEDNTFDNPMYNMPGASGGIQSAPETKSKGAEPLNNNEGPAIMDPSSVTFVKSAKNGEGSTSFANPLYGSNQSNPTLIDPTIRFNPAFTEEGLEEDSII